MKTFQLFAIWLLVALPVQADEVRVERAISLIEAAESLCASSGTSASYSCTNLQLMQDMLSELLLAELNDLVNKINEETVE